MPEKPSPLLPDDERTRDRLRAALAVACVVAVVLAGTVVPAVSGAGLGSTPLGSVFPQPDVNPYGSAGGGGGGSGLAGGGLGALNPGDRTSVGGSLASNASAFRSQNAETHFTVTSTTPSYWRTGAYDTYTGSGWERTGDSQPYDGSVESGGIRGREVEYRVTLRQSAAALPTVWRPTSVSQSAVDSLLVTDQRAFETRDPAPAGTTYSGVSYVPPRDPAVLRTAGRDYPTGIERRYTDLPADTDDRVGEFTDRLTADADSPYESAKRIESWLESNKEYSLNVSQPSGDDVASQFIFEMDEGYCEYFATSMTVMLRSQGIPARYVVGYSTGQSVGANTYRVRALNAHAWVEVYFPDVGWVRFDPTPGSERLETEQRALQNRTDAGEYNHSEAGSPDEEFSPNGTVGTTTATRGGGTTATGGTATGEGTTAPPTAGTSTPTGTATDTGDSTATGGGDGTTSGGGDGTTTGDGDSGDSTTTDESGDGTDSDGSRSSDGYLVALNRTPVPGAMVEVTVTENGSPAVGVPVAFNGDYVGTTGDAGTETARVPYARNLSIAVGSEVGGGSDAGALTSPASPVGVGSMAESGAALSLSAPPPALFASPPENETNATDAAGGTDYELSTNASLTVSGDVVAGREVVVTATVEGVPVREAAVTLDGETVGTTDGSGRVDVRLPDSPGNVTLAVSRGPVSGERTLAIPTLDVAVDPTLPLALPGTAVEVNATYGGDPIANASVRVAGRNLTTGINGTATAALPFRGSASVVVSARGQTRTTTVSGLFANLAMLLGGVAVALGGLGVGAYRRGFGPRRLASLLVGAVRAIPALVVAALFGAADRLSRAVETVLDALRDLRAGETTVRRLLDRLRAWLRERATAIRSSASLGALSSLADENRAGVDGASGEREADSYRTLREAWDSFLAAVSVRRPGALTPGELADHAVAEDDLPPGPVVTLRDAFRDVEYGARSADDRLARVEDAIEAIERATRPDDEDAGSAGGDD